MVLRRWVETALLGQHRAEKYDSNRQKCHRHVFRDVLYPPHCSLTRNVALFWNLNLSRRLGVCYWSRLHVQVIEQVEVRIHVVIIFQGLQIAYGTTGCRRSRRNFNNLRSP